MVYAWDTIQQFKITARCNNVNEPQSIMLWESQAQKTMYFMISFTWSFKKQQKAYQWLPRIASGSENWLQRAIRNIDSGNGYTNLYIE